MYQYYTYFPRNSTIVLVVFSICCYGGACRNMTLVVNSTSVKIPQKWGIKSTLVDRALHFPYDFTLLVEYYGRNVKNLLGSVFNLLEFNIFDRKSIDPVPKSGGEI